jgi:glucan phosphoethanolaminetransferase (alkaline phosphatase superfamily)
MDERELHLVLNHFPVILSVMALFSSLLAIATKSRTAWIYAAASLTIAGLFSYPSFLTGHGAHEVIEDFWYVKADSWHEHQMAAGYANVTLLLGGAFAAYCWWKLTRSKEAVLAKWMEVVLIFACVMGASTVGRTAWLGGKVLRDQEALKTPPKGWVAPPKMEHEH